MSRYGDYNGEDEPESSEDLVEEAFRDAVEARKYIGYCRSCGALDSVLVNPGIIEPKFASEATGWVAHVSKVAVVVGANPYDASIDYELRSELRSHEAALLDDEHRFPQKLPPNQDFWSRQICLKIMKQGQHATDCPHCGLGADLLLSDDDFVKMSNPGEIVRVGTGKL